MTTINLTKPIANGPEMITTLTLRAPRLGDSPLLMRGADAFLAGNVSALADNLLDVLSAISDQPRSVIDQIEPADLDAVLDGLTNFIENYSKR
ncbi:phage tail assembly protein [Shinella oryzae]|uniref:Phage tail assembly protein n=1 Tax=Shinella oryzae TaxID=2871820 RepID=A0ABY9K3G5_9HYPH|nr:phage tail assembly protein [Shinella oryzae]WLS03113.1 phage tail assembly protein [Shinella oryzae]